MLHLGKSGGVAIQDGDVHPRVGEPLLDLAARALQDLQADGRVSSPRLGEQLADQRLSDRGQQAQSDATGRLAGFAAYFLLECLGIRQQGFDLGKQPRSDFGQFDAASGAVEQSRPAFALEGIDLSTQQRLVAVQK